MPRIVPSAALESYSSYLASEDGAEDMADLDARLNRFQQWTEAKVRKATRDDLVEFLGPLWSLRMWGNRAIYVDQVVDDNTLETTRSELAVLLWGKAPIETRWDNFRGKVRRIGPAVMSELLTHFFPQKFIPWTLKLSGAGTQDWPRHVGPERPRETVHPRSGSRQPLEAVA